MAHLLAKLVGLLAVGSDRHAQAVGVLADMCNIRHNICTSKHYCRVCQQAIWVKPLFDGMVDLDRWPLLIIDIQKEAVRRQKQDARSGVQGWKDWAAGIALKGAKGAHRWTKVVPLQEKLEAVSFQWGAFASSHCSG